MPGVVAHNGRELLARQQARLSPWTLDNRRGYQICAADRSRSDIVLRRDPLRPHACASDACMTVARS